MKFATLILFFCLLLIFLKIYQHNVVINLNYITQRLDQKKVTLLKERDVLWMQLCELKNQTQVKKLATQEWGLEPLKVNQIVEYAQEHT